MSDALYNLLAPYLSAVQGSSASSSDAIPARDDAVTTSYLTRLTTLPLESLSSTEPAALQQTAHSITLSLRALSSRSHKAIITSSNHLSTLHSSLPSIAQDSAQLTNQIPKLNDAAEDFAEQYNKTNSNNNPVLENRRKALLLSRNVDRLADILELPSLLSSAISSGASQQTSLAGGANTANYASALDLNAHIRRLHKLYPDSSLVDSVQKQAEKEMGQMASSLISSLRTQGLKLAAAMRTISWLRRIAPELEARGKDGKGGEGSLGALFLVCRLANLMSMLSALEPLQQLADQETAHRINGGAGQNSDRYSQGQTERYLKRYIEIFREQSFAIISVFRSIFPPPSSSDEAALLNKDRPVDPLRPLPSSLSTFPIHLIGMLLEMLKHYLPNIKEKSTRDGLLTQVLYCAGSLGRLGGDFSLVLSFLAEETDEEEEAEWVDVLRKHRVLAGKLESMVGA